MKVLTPSMRRIVAVLALTAASTSAFAQSADYRRGYDDGYAAGQRDSRGDRGDRGRSDWGIRIEEADYGTRGAMCDARRAVRQAVERSGDAVPVGNHLCGDPAVGAIKRLSVVYRCGNGEALRVSAREGETLRLGCRR